MTVAALLSSCAVNEQNVTTNSTLSGTLVGGGSSAQQAAQEAWVSGFQSMHPDATIEYDPAGSGAGRETFLAGGSSFAGSDRAFTTEEIAAGPFTSCAEGSTIIELPTYISPIAIIFNLEGIDNLNLDAETIAKIFTGEITNWNDERIASQNTGIDLPDLQVSAVHRADDSGVTENFTDYLSAAAPGVWSWQPDGEWPFSGGEAAPQTSGVVASVTNGVGTIGYADASRAGDLGTVSVKVGTEYVPYSAQAAAAIVDASPVSDNRAEGDLAIDIDRAPTSGGVYPVVLISYLIGCMEYREAAAAELARAYFEYVISEDAQQAAAAYAGSAPISEDLFERASAATALIR